MEMSDEGLKSILESVRTIAVVGASSKEGRPRNIVSRYLLAHGYDVIPVRPKASEILGRRCYGRLEDIPVEVDMVDVFRRPEACPDIARSAVAIGARVLWLQEGIVSEEASRIAREGGLEVVMAVCVKKIHERLFD